MLPLPTSNAKIFFVGLCAMFVIGLVARSSEVMVLTGSGWVALSVALAASMSIARGIRAQRLEFAWWVEHEPQNRGIAPTPGAATQVRCYIRHRGSGALRISGVRPISSGARIQLPAHFGQRPESAKAATVLEVPPRSRVEFAFDLVPQSVGRLVLHGLALNLHGPWGLFAAPLYFPSPLTIRVLPRATSSARPSPRTLTRLAASRAGINMLRRRGGGTEFYELRELLPGDPFKSIAWKASARRGQLMVKEVEREVEDARWFVIDVGPDVRQGDPGHRALDQIIERTAAEARQALFEGDRVGLVSVDLGVLSHVPLGKGASHLGQIHDSLLAATEIVDEQHTQISNEQLVQRVTKYILQQDGLDFSRPTEGRRRPRRHKRSTSAPRPRHDELSTDVARLTNHIRRARRSLDERDRALAKSATYAALRAYCRDRAIELPFREKTSGESTAQFPTGGLSEGIQVAGGRSRVPATIAVFTATQIHVSEELISTVKLALGHGHRIKLVLFPPYVDHLASRERAAARRDYERSIDHTKNELGRLGVFVHGAPDQAAAPSSRIERRAS